VEVGQEAVATVVMEKKTDFEGEGTAELLGLPTGAVAQPVKFTKDSTELAFPLKVDATAKPGKTTGIVCRTTFLVNGETVTHTIGTTELRIDQPKPAGTAPANKPATPAAAAEQKKSLSRLEQLRLEKEQEGKK